MKTTDLNSVLARENVLELISKQWMLVTAGTIDRFNTMTASWGGVGCLWNKPVAFLFIRPERFTHEFLEAQPRLTLSFYAGQYRRALQICGSKSGRNCDKVAEAGLTPVAIDDTVSFAEARLTFVCRKLFRSRLDEASFIDCDMLTQWYGAHGGLHDVYVVEIEQVLSE